MHFILQQTWEQIRLKIGENLGTASFNLKALT